MKRHDRDGRRERDETTTTTTTTTRVGFVPGARSRSPEGGKRRRRPLGGRAGSLDRVDDGDETKGLDGRSVSLPKQGERRARWEWVGSGGVEGERTRGQRVRVGARTSSVRGSERKRG